MKPIASITFSILCSCMITTSASALDLTNPASSAEAISASKALVDLATQRNDKAANMVASNKCDNEAYKLMLIASDDYSTARTAARLGLLVKRFCRYRGQNFRLYA